MPTQTPVLIKSNQHYQLTVPLAIRKNFPIQKGGWFIVKLLSKGILFRPVEVADDKIDYADPMDQEEIKDIKQSLQELKQGEFTTITNTKELEEHFNNL